MLRVASCTHLSQHAKHQTGGRYAADLFSYSISLNCVDQSQDVRCRCLPPPVVPNFSSTPPVPYDKNCVLHCSGPAEHLALLMCPGSRGSTTQTSLYGPVNSILRHPLLYRKPSVSKRIEHFLLIFLPYLFNSWD